MRWGMASIRRRGAEPAGCEAVGRGTTMQACPCLFFGLGKDCKGGRCRGEGRRKKGLEKFETCDLRKDRVISENEQNL